MSENIINFKRNTTYTGFYEESRKKVSVTILKLTAQETEIECSSLFTRTKILPTNKIFKIENGVEKLRFYNVYHDGPYSQTKWVTVYADNHIPDNPEETCENPFRVGMSYTAEYDRSDFSYGHVPSKCVRRTKCYAWFYLPTQNRTVKVFVKACRAYEVGVTPSTREWKELGFRSEYGTKE